jgi:hypothetical protein
MNYVLSRLSCPDLINTNNRSEIDLCREIYYTKESSTKRFVLSRQMVITLNFSSERDHKTQTPTISAVDNN